MNDVLHSILHSCQTFDTYNAFYINGIYYTYRQLAECISAIRGVIRNANIDEPIWGLALHDDLNTYASIFALWMEGKAYVPLHPSWPKDRILSIKDQVGFTNVLDACDAPYTRLYLDDWADVSDDSLAYILFTSGSTGVPKGVQITRRNVAAFMDSFWKTGIRLDQTDRCLQCFDLTFDVSIQSFLVPLMKGACVYTVPYGQVKYLQAARLIQEEHITFGAMAPSMLTYLRPYFSELDATSMRTTILTAEACPVDLMEAWYDCAKNTEIYDFYGPTEATIYCTYYKLTRGGENLSLNGIISIGKPLANVQAIIIREDGSLVERQEKGELCVAGDQVTPGYWKNPEKNTSSFFFRNRVRYYHTGDLCYWDICGNIMYSGRIDQQAKIQGFRVELSEIEFHAREYFNKDERVLAIAFQNDRNLTEIALFIESEPMDTTELVEYMRNKMPAYMIPTRILFEAEFPLNKSEKIDRNILKQKVI